MLSKDGKCYNYIASIQVLRRQTTTACGEDVDIAYNRPRCQDKIHINAFQLVIEYLGRLYRPYF